MSVRVEWDESDEFLTAFLYFELEKPLISLKFDLIDECDDGYKEILNALRTNSGAKYMFVGGIEILVEDMEITFKISSDDGCHEMSFDGKLFEPAFTEIAVRFIIWNS
jgi:hypothetical protein